MLSNLDRSVIAAAMETALDKFHVEYPEVNGHALDTIQRFASERFTTACARIDVSDARFTAEASDYAYHLLVQETLTLARALKGRT